MKKILLIILGLVFLTSCTSELTGNVTRTSIFAVSNADSVHDFSVRTIDLYEKPLSDYSGKVLLIVNVASFCEYTYQYEGLQELYEQYVDQGFEILAFPSNQFGNQEPNSNTEIQGFCSSNYGVTFPLFDKVDVKGPNKISLFAYLEENAPYEKQGEPIQWNFEKILIRKNGTPYMRYNSDVEPMDLADEIELLLSE
jgi:glutathione peroxidase